nr:hypothetical protein [Mycoplasmopsis bovis]
MLIEILAFLAIIRIENTLISYRLWKLSKHNNLKSMYLAMKKHYVKFIGGLIHYKTSDDISYLHYNKIKHIIWYILEDLNN